MPNSPRQIREKEKLVQEYERAKIHKIHGYAASEHAGGVLCGAEKMVPDELCYIGYWCDVKDIITEVTKDMSEEEILKEKKEDETRAQAQLDRLDKIKSAISARKKS
jgi:hypothetical protein